jgi:hypothetical protein
MASKINPVCEIAEKASKRLIFFWCRAPNDATVIERKAETPTTKCQEAS